MKLILAFVLALSTTLAFAKGGIQDRKTKSTISIECRDEACNNFVFLETHYGGDFSEVLSREISKDEMVKSAKEGKYVLDNMFPEFLYATSQVAEAYAQNPAITFFFLPGYIFIIGATAVSEIIFDGVVSAQVAISNGVKARKIGKFFNDQLNKGGKKTFKLRHKNYLRFKRAVSQF